MPLCRLCLKVQPTAEVKRTRMGHVCKDKTACAVRVERIQDHARAIASYGAVVQADDPVGYWPDLGVDHADYERKRDKGE